MRFAVISDIHSNLEAFLAVLKKCREEQVEQIFCLGDIIGYGPNPRECLLLAQRNCQIIVRGNHEDMIINLEASQNYIHPHALAGIKYTIDNLTSADQIFLEHLPLTQTLGDDFHFSHSNFSHPDLWGTYVESPEDFSIQVNRMRTRIGVIGHTHVPCVYFHHKDKTLKPKPIDGWYKVELGDRYIINVGSVGQPRDGTSQATFGIFDYDPPEIRFKLVYVLYDIKKTAAKILAAGLPASLAQRYIKEDK